MDNGPLAYIRAYRGASAGATRTVKGGNEEALVPADPGGGAGLRLAHARSASSAAPPCPASIYPSEYRANPVTLEVPCAHALPLPPSSSLSHQVLLLVPRLGRWRRR